VKSKIGIVVDDSRWRDVLPDAIRVCRRAASSALADIRDEGGPVELCVMLSDDVTVADLNERFRGKRGPTNVLSFPVRSPLAPERGGERETRMIGDIVLAVETVVREARRDGKTVSAHVAHLVVHGVLHLLGHDHARDADAARMEALEVAVLARLGVGDPYA
jgi:probable rRNA maturation factor